MKNMWVHVASFHFLLPPIPPLSLQGIKIYDMRTAKAVHHRKWSGRKTNDESVALLGLALDPRRNGRPGFSFFSWFSFTVSL